MIFRWSLVVAVLGLAGCVESNSVRCSDGRVCPSGSICGAATCLLPEQLAQCDGQPDLAPCSYAGVPAGACFAQVCLPAGCGNGEVEPDEACDDGNHLAGDGCSADCRSTETCGNGVIDTVRGESCDDGNLVDGDSCQANCVVPTCGDGIVDSQFNEACDTGTARSNAPNAPCRPNCQVQRCGDGVVDDAAGEICDDGNLAPGDGCTPDCKSTEVCGNAYLDFLEGEQCDDGNLLSGDNCTRSCTFELPTWSTASTGTFPPDRAEQVTVYDPARGALVVFGGYLPAGGYLDDTWEWNGATWVDASPAQAMVVLTQRSGAAMVFDSMRGRTLLFGGTTGGAFPNRTFEWDGTAWADVTPAANNPPGRYQFAMAYDSHRHRAVVFGGQGLSGTTNDTWEWDGTGWADVTPAGAKPPVRKGQAMAYDPVRGKVVLFGGVATSTVGPPPYTFYGDTWEWDGTTWSDVTPGSGNPPIREGHAMAFDAVTGHVMMFGGWSHIGATQTFYADTWEWNGTAWSDVTPGSGSPPGRYHHSLSFDAAGGRVFLFAGETLSGLTHDEWAWNGSTWSQITAPPVPAARRDFGFAYDALRGRAVMFGGYDGQSAGVNYDDTWEWDGGRWSDVTPAGVSPSTRTNFSLVYDAARKKVVLFGGEAGPTDYNDTWTWDGSTWTDVTPGSGNPGVRDSYAIAYDAKHGVVVMFGGSLPDVPYYAADTWIWNGSTWTDVTPATGNPPARYFAGMAYDAARGVVVMEGGRGASVLLDDVWEWNGTMWTQRVPTGVTPSPRQSAKLTYDAARRHMILFGGTDAIYRNDTWEWDGARWTSLAPAVSPPARTLYDVAADDARGELVLFGGTSQPTTINFNDTWRFRYRSGPVESCVRGFDGDGDGVKACADPDCWGYCTPLCPPGATCDPAAPKCGDGVCNAALENCRLCPGDCGACVARCGDLLCDAGESAATCPGDCP